MLGFLLVLVLLIRGVPAYLRTVTSHRKSASKIQVEFKATNYKGEEYKRPLGASQLAIGVTADVTCSSQQVHVSLGDNDNTVKITFASTNASAGIVYYSENEEDVINNSGYMASSKSYTSSYSQLIWITGNLYAPSMGAQSETTQYITNLQNSSQWAFSMVNGVKQKWANYHYQGPTPTNGLGQYNNPYMVYDSPIIHTVEITNLVPGQTYFYKPVDSCELFEFTMPSVATGSPSDYPFNVGLTCDIGQTAVSNASKNALLALDPSVILLAGDLSYSDGFYELWDKFANLMEPLASKIPILTTGGNHEFSSSESWLSYMNRYPTPHEGSGSTNFCYYGKEVGVIHVVTLCSYAGFDEGTLQYKWLQEYLATSINRTKTPWLVAMMHVPFYSSNSGHWMEGELMRRSIEPLLYQYGVDIVLVGHVHAYERTYNVYNNTVDPCGPVHMNLGDGGNYEGSYVPWLMPAPVWSAFREASFGVGHLEFLSNTQANFSWHRHACDSNSASDLHMNFSDSCVTYNDNSAQAMLTSDYMLITKPPASQCPNRWISTASSSPVVPQSSSSSSSNSLSSLEIGLSVAVSILGFTSILFAILWMRLYLNQSNKPMAQTANI